MKKIMLVFGTRPEAIKMAPLIKELEQAKDDFQLYVCVTGQHRQMLDQVLSLFEITPDIDLNIMKPNQDLYDITSNILLLMRDVFKEYRPDLVLVHGDTSSSTAAALAAFYQQIPVGHIEAGLRTHNIYSPWPEEMNRQLTGRLTSFHFSPTPLSKSNLLSEGIKGENIFVTGNTVIDALYLVLDKIKTQPAIRNAITDELEKKGIPESAVLQWEADKKLILITGHRRENFGQGFINICNAIKDLAIANPEVHFLYPMHLNPNVRKPIDEVFGMQKALEYPNVYFVEPLDYLPFVYLMSLSDIVLTDSGGIQEEAPGLGKPVLVMRDTTERPEAVDAGTVKLVGTDHDQIVANVQQLLDDKQLYQRMSQAKNPYGDGNSCKVIVDVLKHKL